MHSDALSGIQRHSEALRGTQRHSEALRGTQRHSDALRGNQTQSDAISSTQRALSGTQRAPGPETATMTQIASAIIGGATAARARPRLLRHRRAHLPVPFAADHPRSAALVLRAPAPQAGQTPADCAARYNDNAEVKAFFASGQVRPIRVQSEATQRSSEGTQRALRGLSEAIRGTQWPSEGSQRPVSGTQRPSEAIRGHSETLTGHQRQLRGHPWPSFAISSTQ